MTCSFEPFGGFICQFMERHAPQDYIIFCVQLIDRFRGLADANIDPEKRRAGSVAQSGLQYISRLIDCAVGYQVLWACHLSRLTMHRGPLQHLIKLKTAFFSAVFILAISLLPNFE